MPRRKLKKDVVDDYIDKSYWYYIEDHDRTWFRFGLTHTIDVLNHEDLSPDATIAWGTLIKRSLANSHGKAFHQIGSMFVTDFLSMLYK